VSEKSTEKSGRGFFMMGMKSRYSGETGAQPFWDNKQPAPWF